MNQIEGIPGAPPGQVTGKVNAAFAELDSRLSALDARWDAGERLDTLYEDVLRVTAWMHGTWIRIHPFVDHNGSTARLLAILVALRYELLLPLPGKPRSMAPVPVGLPLSYDLASQNQMLGDDEYMVLYLHGVLS